MATTHPITRITTENWLGLPGLTVDLAQFTLFCGENGVGKTSLLQAVQFALFNTYPREAKKIDDLETLLSRGSSSGFVEVTIEGRAVKRSVKTGKLGKVAVPSLPPLAPWILSPGAFTARPEAERRTALMDLLQVKATPEAIGERLLGAGMPERIVAELRGLLSKGFAAAEKRAKERASECRGAWQAITGETYGAVKGEDWAPPQPEGPSAEDLAENEALLAKLTGEVNGLNQAIGAASRRMDDAERERLEHAAARLDDYLAAEQRGHAKERELEDRVRALSQPTPQSGYSGTTTPCPHCEKLVVIDAGHLRLPVDAPSADALRAATDNAEALATARRELADVQAKMVELRATIRSATAGKDRLAAEPKVEGEKTAEQLRDELSAKLTQQTKASALVNMQRSQRAAMDKLNDAGDRAKAEHRGVQDYTKAAELLSPNGIPSVLVAQVLDPVNEWLAAAATGAGWPRVRIDAEMVLWFGETPYALASESEQWRLDAAMAYALAGLSNLHVLLLDRLDVLHPNTRAGTLRWLHGLAGSGWQVIAAATLKEAPKIPGITAIWLDGAAVGRLAA